MTPSVFSLPPSSPRIETARTFLAAFADLSTSQHLSVRSDDCIQIFAPSSLNPPAPKDNATFASHLAGLRDVMSGFPVTAKEMIDSEFQNAVTIWATSEAQFHDKLKDDGLSADEWNYRGEYVFMLTMDETGRRITRIVEFLDSKATERLRGLMARARDNLEKLLSQDARS
ncbi:hypothetical protein A1O1_07984 [Capronia coronata CBS 617.96]|uniref:SnoaL-like domain-containing protein n=1 Tax=Capronia coronata CBS 617.96 TaxID=1182541 RepID=W9XN17_9EURO|nr:uncharacterized protein A1O1_07984 [Capronia coronata CBS 617.96]EXJ81917.1 hypothetical protein A1O1_07984 [Capronia coronata CBS 617.96]